MFTRLLPRSMTLRQKLMLTIGGILLVCQFISAFWLWHESKEQIQLLVQGALHNRNNHRHIEHEIREAVASLLVPSLVMITLTLCICFQAVKWITRPLLDLQRELETRTADNLTPVTLTSNVTEVDAVADAINQLVTRLNTTLESERLFTADVAHELRTPLAGIRLHLELLSKAQGINVAPLLTRIDQMTQSVSQLLQMARVSQSFSAGIYQHVSLREDVILPLHDELTTMLSTRRQTLTLPTSGIADTVPGDATLLRVLLRNLVENAHRYSPEQAVIALAIHPHDGAVELVVDDQGPGIDEAKRGELSKAFVRMDSRYGGIGLGLSIVTRITQLHHGQFILQNREGATGCRAAVRLPLATT